MSAKNITDYIFEDITDPFDVYGPGIKCYFGIIRRMLYFFIFASLILIPVFYFNLQGGAYKAQKYWLEKFSLGNLGQAHVECLFQYQGLDKNQNIRCNKGKISNLKYWGLNPKNGETKEELDHCGHYNTHSAIKICTELKLDASIE